MTVLAPSCRPALARHARLSFDAGRDRYVLLSPETVAVLNGTSAAILRLCDGRRTVAEIVTELQASYDRVVEDDVAAFLRRMVTRRCVEVGDGS